MIVLGITSRTWGNEFATEPSARWTCLIFITLYDAACSWAAKERCVGSDDERENNGKPSCGNDSADYERVYVKAYV